MARAALWNGEDDTGRWVAFERTFRDGHTEQWWALEAECAPYGPGRPERLVVATTDPATLPELTTYYLITNLPAPDTERALYDELCPADLAEITRLYSLRNWIEQSYKQVKISLGWAQYQVRKDLSIRRHWQLVCCAFSFCWWACRECSEIGSSPVVALKDAEHSLAATDEAAGGKKEFRYGAPHVMAAGSTEGALVAGTVRNAPALLASIHRFAPTRTAQGVAG